MFTDMVGYTALAQSNESQAMEVLERHNRLLRPFFPRFHGKEVKAIGDSFLAEFDSTLDALKCALEIQSFLHDYNISSKEEWKIKLRIGIHLGDVIHQGSDILGDAVNIASRIEPVADPEGVCVSEQVYGQVSNKFERPLISLGEKRLKNLSVPIEVYKIQMPWDGTTVLSPVPSNMYRVAVLPFANMSPDPGDEYFADGITEEIISTASKIQGLDVISRTSIMRYKQTNKGSTEIGRELNVAKLLEGSVRKSGNHLRITVQLIDAKNDRHIWAETYDRELQDVFAVQSDIAQNVAHLMKVRLLEEDRDLVSRGSTRNPSAYVTYLKGLHFMNLGSREGSLKAIEHFQQAISADPAFAVAYAALADCYIYMEGSYMSSKEAFPKAKSTAQKAIELDDSLAEVHTSLGNIHLQYDWDWAKAGEELDRAIELNPKYSNAHMWKGVYLAVMRRAEEGVKEVQRAEELNPLSPVVKLNVGVLLYYGRRYDEAIAKLDEGIELEGRNDMLYLLKGWSYNGMSMHDAAIEEISKGLSEGDSSDIIAGLGYANALAGRRTEALELLARLNNLGEKALNPFTNAALIHIGLGEADQAVDLLEKAVANRETWFVMTCGSPLYDSIRSFPRFVDLIRKIGLSE
jgi:TolB-like protein/Tfp pilus assembly protein PilF